ncbi:MAG: N-methyl-L-tryptophan oxidase [Armatimonadetes bacterium]|nr:N-methyl-L-tryptophan oxidase [Armatimonadota bacterium]MDE2208029.1 N-methyl-L-tryptophan oxidase [Armatimonadota bacterium]
MTAPHVLVVGCGVVGAMAAWRLALAGARVTVFEQFQLDHSKGSSHGESRIVRNAYPEPFYTGLMRRAWALWDEFCDANPTEELLVRCGGITLGPRDHSEVRSTTAALAANGVQHEVWDSRAAMARYPLFHLDRDEVAVYDAEMGFVRASACVRAAKACATALGAKFVFGARVDSVAAARGGVRAEVYGQQHIGDAAILAPGPWLQPLLNRAGQSAPVRVTRQVIAYCAHSRYQHACGPDEFPVWIDAATHFYGFPHITHPGLKVAHHRFGEVADADSVYRRTTRNDLKPLAAYISRRLTGFTPVSGSGGVCLYTVTPDADFIADGLPGVPRAFVIGGLSGHGFKFAPLLGELAACRALDKPLPCDVERFRLSRFATSPAMAGTPA